MAASFLVHVVKAEMEEADAVKEAEEELAEESQLQREEKAKYF